MLFCVKSMFVLQIIMGSVLAIKVINTEFYSVSIYCINNASKINPYNHYNSKLFRGIINLYVRCNNFILVLLYNNKQIHCSLTTIIKRQHSICL